MQNIGQNTGKYQKTRREYQSVLVRKCDLLSYIIGPMFLLGPISLSDLGDRSEGKPF